MAFLVIFWPNKCLLSTKRCSFEFKDNTSYSVLVISNLLISLVPYFKAKMALIFCIYVFCPKGGFFSESALCFLDLQISKKIFQKTILSLKFKFPANYSILLLGGNLNFKLRIVFWNIFFEICWSKKHIALSEKKPPLDRWYWKCQRYSDFSLYIVVN